MPLRLVWELFLRILGIAKKVAGFRRQIFTMAGSWYARVALWVL